MDMRRIMLALPEVHFVLAHHLQFAIRFPYHGVLLRQQIEFLLRLGF
jgi:hypothetical protein